MQQAHVIAVRPTTSRLEFHKGRAVLSIADTYPTVLQTALEQVQNAIDANATRIGIILNQKMRSIVITDNGDGASKEKFETALQQICSTMKQKGKLGRFGRGLISPLGKCQTFTFTSCPKGGKSYIEWTFDTSEIEQQADNVEVPHRYCPNLAFKHNAPGSGEKNGSMILVPYRTRVALEGYHPDKFVNRVTTIDALIDSVFERFGVTMRRNDVRLSVKFVDERGREEVRENLRPKLFTGRRLDPFEVNQDRAGFVSFELYLSPKTTKGYRGKVLLGEQDDDYRFPFQSFARSAREYLPAHIIEALSSGVFEGEILSTGARLHANRKNFERNQAFVDVCVAIELWYQEQGADCMAQVKEATEEARYQDLGLRSLGTIEEMLKDPRFKDLREVIRGFKHGTIGDGHIEPDESGVLGLQDEPALSTDVLDEDDGKKARPKQQPKNENPQHEPFTVIGPKGQRRTVVSNGSLGLQISHRVMEGSDRLYEVDANLGVIYFNIRHPTWVACEDSDRQLMQLQELTVLKVLTLLAMPAEWKDIIEFGYDELDAPFVFLIQHSAAFSRGPAPKALTPEESES